MTETIRQLQSPTPEEIAWSGVATSFAAFGRVFICLDRQFRIVHASYVLDELVGAGPVARVGGDGDEAHELQEQERGRNRPRRRSAVPRRSAASSRARPPCRRSSP